MIIPNNMDESNLTDIAMSEKKHLYLKLYTVQFHLYEIKTNRQN